MKTINKIRKNGWFNFCAFIAMMFFAETLFAGKETLGTMASTITATFGSVGKLVTAASYIAGLGFSISAILKFKAHKDNAQQTPIGQPIGLMFVGASLLFLPSLLTSAGNTIFSQGGETAGPEGTEITGS